MGRAITGPRLMVCEGPNDRMFFETLIQRRALPAFDVHSTVDRAAGGPGGIAGFRPYLEWLPIEQNFANVTEIVIVADCDANDLQNFQNVSKQISDAKIQASPAVTFKPPAQPNTIDSGVIGRSGAPRISVLMVPGVGVSGCLETLCLEAVSRDHQLIVDAAAAFGVAIGGPAGWRPNKYTKMQMEVVLAGASKNWPDVSFGKAVVELQIIPLDHSCFDPLADFLKRFAP